MCADELHAGEEAPRGRRLEHRVGQHEHAHRQDPRAPDEHEGVAERTPPASEIAPDVGEAAGDRRGQGGEAGARGINVASPRTERDRLGGERAAVDDSGESEPRQGQQNQPAGFGDRPLDSAPDPTDRREDPGDASAHRCRPLDGRAGGDPRVHFTEVGADEQHREVDPHRLEVHGDDGRPLGQLRLIALDQVPTGERQNDRRDRRPVQLQVENGTARPVVRVEEVDFLERGHGVGEGVFAQKLPRGVEREEGQNADEEDVVDLGCPAAALRRAVDVVEAALFQLAERRHRLAQNQEHADEAREPGENGDGHHEKAEQGIGGAESRGHFDHQIASQPPREVPRQQHGPACGDEAQGQREDGEHGPSVSVVRRSTGATPARRAEGSE